MQSLCEVVKCQKVLDDYEKTLQGLNNIDVLESNNAIILQRRGDVKRMLSNY